jgi:hypothetical protein
MPNMGFRKPLGGESIHPLPGHAMALTALAYDATPGAEYPFPAHPEPAHVARDSRVPIVPYDNTCEPCPALLNGPVHTLSQGWLALLEFRA